MTLFTKLTIAIIFFFFGFAVGMLTIALSLEDVNKNDKQNG